MGARVSMSEMSGDKDDKSIMFNGDNYDKWRDAMKMQLKSKGAPVWNAVVSKDCYLKNESKISKDDQKFNSIALQIIKRTLSIEVKKKLGYFTSARKLWLKMEDIYQAKYQSVKEDASQKSSEEVNEEMLRNKEENTSPISSENKEDSMPNEKVNENCNDKELTEEKYYTNAFDIMWMESNTPRRTRKSSVNTENDLKILKDEFYALTQKYEAAEVTVDKQRILLVDKERELKDAFSNFNSQLEDKNEKINELKTEVMNLRRQIEANKRGLPDQDEKHNLLEWEKNFQEKQERLIRRQRLLDRKEEQLNITLKQFQEELKDDKKKIEKDHAILKEKEARYQRLVTLASGKGDATKEKSPINKGEKDFVGLINNEMKRSYSAALKNTFISGNKKEKVNYFSPEHISSSKRNKENGFENSSAIVDEIWAKQRPAHDRSGLGYIKDKRATHRTPTTKCEESISSSKDQYSSVKWNYENPFRSYSSHKYEPRTVKYDATRSSSRMIRCWRCKHVGHTTKFCHTIRCFRCKGFGHKAIDCRSTSSTSESTLKSFKEESFPNTSKRKMKKVWRLKKIPSTDDETKNSPEYQHPTNSKIEGDTHVISDEHSMVEENPSIDEDLEMALLLC